MFANDVKEALLSVRSYEIILSRLASFFRDLNYAYYCKHKRKSTRYMFFFLLFLWEFLGISPITVSRRECVCACARVCVRERFSYRSRRELFMYQRA